MKYRSFKTSFLLLFVLLIATPILVQGQNAVQFSYLYVRPAAENSKLKPYVMQILQSPEPFGLIFAEDVDVTLFAPTSTIISLQVNPIIPHTASGGYRFVDNIIWSASSYNLDETTTAVLKDPAFKDLTDSKQIDPDFLSATRPQLVTGQREILVINKGSEPYKPITAGRSYESCTTQEDVKGSLTLDFAQDSQTYPTFQVTQLGEKPIRFRIASFDNSKNYIAIANNFSSDGQPLEIGQFSLGGDALGSVKLLARDVWAKNQPADTNPYRVLFQSLERAGTRAFPISLVSSSADRSQMIEIQFQNGPACRNWLNGKTHLEALSGLNGVPFVYQGREGNQGTLKPSESVLLKSIQSDGKVCYDQPGTQPNNASANQVPLACSDSWLLTESSGS